MSEQSHIELREILLRGLDLSHETMLRKKTLLNESVIISDGNGHPVEVPAKELLEKYLAEKVKQ
jgi:hypothetical protein